MNDRPKIMLIEDGESLGFIVEDTMDAHALEGIEKHRIDQVEAKIYYPENALADCFNFRNKIGMDIVLEALKLYRSKNTQDENHLPLREDIPCGTCHPAPLGRDEMIRVGIKLNISASVDERLLKKPARSAGVLNSCNILLRSGSSTGGVNPPM